MNLKFEAEITAITDSKTLEKVLKHLPELFNEFVENELESPHFLVVDTIGKAMVSTDSANQNETYIVSFTKSIPIKKGYATLTYRCVSALVENISKHYVLLSGEFDVFYEDSDKPRKETIKRLRKKIGSSSLSIEPLN